MDDTTRRNIIIAKFMGYVLDNSFPDKGRVYRKGNSIELDTTFKYHLSWDLLMPVVKKIDEYEPDFGILISYDLQVQYILVANYLEQRIEHMNPNIFKK